ncbi:MAG: DNA-processing protein DprA [Verrucomicrobiota bacterium]|nr:DNA-processing protein DprA [Verrucomicrobiota bacterium]
MTEPLTTNTQAILLLTAPLLAGRSDMSADLLKPSEYNRLARLLREKQLQPADLLRADAPTVLRLLAPIFGQERLEALLARGFLLSQAVDRWAARSIWVISRADETYPRRLKSRLREDAPPVLYGCGDAALLENGGLAVVGSRHVDQALTDYTEELGRTVAAAKRSVVSGAAKGIDKAAMHGALRGGGNVIGVMADSLERAALARDNREPLMNGRLVFISAYDPAAGFNVGHAMNRNKAIYALADAALVVTADFEKGGTWTGAIEQLERLRFVPVFVRNGASAGRGNAALMQRGARPWPEPRTTEEFQETLSSASHEMAAEPKQEKLAFRIREEASLEKPHSAAQLQDEERMVSPACALFRAVETIVTRELNEPRSEAEVAKMFDVSKAQMKGWLQQLLKQGSIEKLTKPTRYRTIATKNLL